MSTGQPATKLNEAKHCACACGSPRLGQNECSTRTVGVTELTWFSACGELQLELVSGSVQLLELQKQTRKSEDHKELNLSRSIYIYIYIYTYLYFLFIFIYIYIYIPQQYSLDATSIGELLKAQDALPFVPCTENRTGTRLASHCSSIIGDEHQPPET